MTAGLTLVALIVLAGTSERTGRVGAVLLAAASVLWLLVNGPMEGPILVVLSQSHALTTADLAGFAGLLVALWRFVEHRHQPRTR